jgi:hypothetical protein
MRLPTDLILFLCSCILALLLGVALHFANITAFPPKIIPYETNHYDFYSPFSDIYIKKMVSSNNGATVHFYPEGNVVFSFTTDGIVRKETGNHFVECTMSGNGMYITITNTDIPFLPEINPLWWGTPIGDNDDFSTMKELFKTPREGQCDVQVNFMVDLARDENIIARRINMWQAPADGMLTAEGHTTMEIYDRKMKRWIWMDPMYNIVGGKTGTRILTLRDLQVSVNRGENITLTTTEGEEIQFNTWQHSKTWKNYLNPSQVISYVVP